MLCTLNSQSALHKIITSYTSSRSKYDSSIRIQQNKYYTRTVIYLFFQGGIGICSHKFSKKKWVCDNVEYHKAQERLWQKLWLFPTNISQMKHLPRKMLQLIYILKINANFKQNNVAPDNPEFLLTDTKTLISSRFNTSERLNSQPS